MISNCKICPEIKPCFLKHLEIHVIKATQPIESSSINFKGPLPSSCKNQYLLAIVDKFLRFLFAFPCSIMKCRSVIRCSMQMFHFYLFIFPLNLSS